MNRPNFVAARKGESDPGTGGFTLVELLVVLGVIALLAALLLPALNRGKSSAQAIQCCSQLRQMGLAIRLYAENNGDEFPRSQHSAFAHGQLTWGRAIASELGQRGPAWTNLLTGVYHCPADRRSAAWSYGQNVYFELDPAADDYVGRPKTWRRMTTIPRPAGTILDAETGGGADHIMPHFWMSVADATDVAQLRHQGRSNYSFVDGHVEGRRFADTWDAGSRVDSWNPLSAE